MVLGAAEPTKVEQPFRSTREGYAHAVEQINNRRCHLAHCFGWWLVRQEIAAVNCVIEMLIGRIAFALGVDGAVYATLGADRV